eukprot:TRINITY_DN7385_c0_g1_i2.p1 TRINITY_DN7385_c0_g1~~TRINITY_DN7385_c0_g1_i2.p1  ORF type:complete len:214 (+),score=17.82 TRINITY_DN7385_c0_g1_i2:349-990(+)
MKWLELRYFVDSFPLRNQTTVIDNDDDVYKFRHNTLELGNLDIDLDERLRFYYKKIAKYKTSVLFNLDLQKESIPTCGIINPSVNTSFCSVSEMSKVNILLKMINALALLLPDFISKAKELQTQIANGTAVQRVRTTFYKLLGSLGCHLKIITLFLLIIEEHCTVEVPVTDNLLKFLNNCLTQIQRYKIKIAENAWILMLENIIVFLQKTTVS